jgi:hypothetical protein
VLQKRHRGRANQFWLVKWKGWKARTGTGVTGGDGTAATDWEPERNLGEELFHVRRKGARKGSKPNGLITQFFLDRDGKEGRPFLDPTAGSQPRLIGSLDPDLRSCD